MTYSLKCRRTMKNQVSIRLFFLTAVKEYSLSMALCTTTSRDPEGA
ncbi:unnamed protein product [Linum tenue]|uniref:Uncharacterized protein n=1 Tax=Linum tenue TaxID=586396 RepID=A0AAV0RZ58_9ROSI|nr:unnamed protein product [Linum tenue]